MGWAEETSQDWWVILTQPTKRTDLESNRDLYVGFVKQAFPENRLTPFSHGGSIQHLWPQACLWMGHILHVSQIILGSLLFWTGYDTTLLEYHTNQLGSGKQSYHPHSSHRELIALISQHDFCNQTQLEDCVFSLLEYPHFVDRLTVWPSFLVVLHSRMQGDFARHTYNCCWSLWTDLSVLGVFTPSLDTPPKNKPSNSPRKPEISADTIKCHHFPWFSPHFPMVSEFVPMVFLGFSWFSHG